ncbi:MAG: 2-phosphosulfolactate phosphatase [Ilumatobacteraceae bacterium]
MQLRVLDGDEASALRGGVAVVVDVMRAFTVAAWALHLGAVELLLVDDIEEAVGQASTIPGSLLFKDGAPDHRFDLHNSPRQLLDLDVRDRVIVQRTTAGTRAAVAARRADLLLCASFVCASATARVLQELGRDDVSFVVSGGHGADEDLACAELIGARVDEVDVSAERFIERAAVSEAARDLAEGVARGYAGVTSEDVPMCLEVDRFDFAMQAIEGRRGLTLRLHR